MIDHATSLASTRPPLVIAKPEGPEQLIVAILQTSEPAARCQHMGMRTVVLWTWCSCFC